MKSLIICCIHCENQATCSMEQKVIEITKIETPFAVCKYFTPTVSRGGITEKDIEQEIL